MEKQKTTWSTDVKDAPEVLDDRTYVLRLYVKGHTPNSRRAMANAEKICREHLQGRYELEIIDVNEHPERAREEDIIAIPSLIRELPGPLHKLIGDLSDKERVLIGLGLIARPG